MLCDCWWRPWWPSAAIKNTINILATCQTNNRFNNVYANNLYNVLVTWFKWSLSKIKLSGYVHDRRRNKWLWLYESMLIANMMSHIRPSEVTGWGGLLGVLRSRRSSPPRCGRNSLRLFLASWRETIHQHIPKPIWSWSENGRIQKAMLGGIWW